MVLSRTGTRQLLLEVSIPYHYNTEADYVMFGEESLLYCLFHGTSSGKKLLKDDQAALTELLTVRKQCKRIPWQ